MAQVRSSAIRGLYALGWRFAARLPRGLVVTIISAASRLAVRQNGEHLRTLRRNLQVASGAEPSRDLLQAAMASYLRNFYEVLALPGWHSSEIVRRVTTSNEHYLRTAFAEQGAIVALPHSANWDLAGAWACLTGMPVTTVAERLGDAEFEAFLRFRQGLGMEVLSSDDAGTISGLSAALRKGRLVCLVADRDLLGSGARVRWGQEWITMPAGPAMVARRTGAALIPAVCQFTPDGMKINFAPPVLAEPGRTGLIQMTQQVADFFAERIGEQPADWHMLQPFFASDPPTRAEVG